MNFTEKRTRTWKQESSFTDVTYWWMKSKLEWRWLRVHWWYLLKWICFRDSRLLGTGSLDHWTRSIDVFRWLAAIPGRFHPMNMRFQFFFPTRSWTQFYCTYTPVMCITLPCVAEIEIEIFREIKFGKEDQDHFFHNS